MTTPAIKRWVYLCPNCERRSVIREAMWQKTGSLWTMYALHCVRCGWVGKERKRSKGGDA